MSFSYHSAFSLIITSAAESVDNSDVSCNLAEPSLPANVSIHWLAAPFQSAYFSFSVIHFNVTLSERVPAARRKWIHTTTNRSVT